MKVKTIGVLFTVLLFVFVTGLPAYGAQGGESGPPENGGPPDGVGPPVGEMMDVSGCAYFDEVLGVWRLRARNPEAPGCLPENPETDWKIDFGPEGYCPDPCLTGELITDELNGTEPVEIKIGMNYVGTFRWSDDLNTILAQTDEGGPAYNDGDDPSVEWIPLTPAEGTNYGRPQEGKWTRVYGRAGETDYAVLVWEIKYNWLANDYLNWYWWRSSGQPWAKMWLLDCVAPGEEEVPTGGGGGSGGGGKGKK